MTGHLELVTAAAHTRLAPAVAATSTCPKCTQSREQRDGSYFVCQPCGWRWTVSITGRVYVQGTWRHETEPQAPPSDAQKLLRSVPGLAGKLSDLPAAPPIAEQSTLSQQEIERLRSARAAAEAGYFDEGVPLTDLRTSGVPLILPEDDSAD